MQSGRAQPSLKRTKLTSSSPLDFAGPLLQPLSRDAQVSFAILKCVPLNNYTDRSALAGAHGTYGSGAYGGGLAAAALDALVAAAAVEVPWSARAAALSFAQTLWFRHGPLMSHEQHRRLQVGD